VAVSTSGVVVSRPRKLPDSGALARQTPLAARPCRKALLARLGRQITACNRCSQALDEGSGSGTCRGKIQRAEER
jgi:hypothetical protein